MRNRSLLLILLCGIFAPLQSSVADGLEIREWLVPWKNSTPRDPYVDKTGRVWFVGQSGNYVANMKPTDGLFNRYDLESGTGPHNLIVDDERNIWYAESEATHRQAVSIDRTDHQNRDAKPQGQRPAHAGV